jgi:hypothetical protein
MAMKGFDQIKRNLEQLTEDIAVKKPTQTIVAILQVASNISMKYAPIEYSTLVNSRKTRVFAEGDTIAGTLGYYVEYAASLNNPRKGSKLDGWQPVPQSKKKTRKTGKNAGKARASNPLAGQGFLNKGFESEEAKREIQIVITEINKV